MEKDTNKNLPAKSEQEQGLSSPLRYFSDDESFVFVFKKTQKLVSALYLITGFFQDSEPLKWNLRSLGSKLLSSSIFLKDGSSSKRDKAVVDIRAYVLEVTALFAVAKQAGMISSMNYEIVNKEFSLLLNSILLSEQTFNEETADLKAGFFHVEKVEKKVTESTMPEISSGPLEAKETNKPHTLITDKSEKETDNFNKTNLLEQSIHTAHEKDLESIKGQNLQNEYKQSPSRTSESKDLKEYGAVAVKKNSRQSIIISLLKRKKDIMIKDVSPLIDGCSEKTIQRELLAMVNLGILKKEGEKRWSKYSLLKP